jgi:hypothetical protein
MALWQWSTTAANNATADPSINWQEGQAPSTVNDSARAMMAVLASSLMANREWINFGDTPTYVNATQFTVPGNQTANYTVGRRVKATVTAGTVYGTITTSAFTSATTVTVKWDGSGALDSGLSEVDVGVINPANPSLSTLPTLTVGSGTTAAEVDLILSNANTLGWFYLINTNGQMGFFDSTRSLIRWSSDTSGNFTAAGNITASSDERLKSDWEYMPSDFIERLAAIRSGTYARVDLEDGKRHAGVSAQSLQALLPEAVLESEKGLLSVAYGNAALVACVELAKEVVRLRALVEPK